MGNELLQSFLIITNQNVKADINRGIEVNYNNIDKYIENTKKFLNVTLTEDEYKLVFHDIEQRFSIKLKTLTFGRDTKGILRSFLR